MAGVLLGLASVPLHADNFYVAGFAGGNYIQSNVDALKYHYDWGYITGGNIGYRWSCSGWRLEGEYSFRKDRIRAIHRDHAKHGAEVLAHQNYYAGMGNIYFDFYLPNTWLTPFIGGGVGWFQQTVRFEKIRFNRHPHRKHKTQTAILEADEGIKTGIAYQILVGMSYEVNCMWSCYMTYRMLKPCRDNLNFFNHSITGGLRYDF